MAVNSLTGACVVGAELIIAAYKKIDIRTELL
jgi:hypothetical protein